MATILDTDDSSKIDDWMGRFETNLYAYCWNETDNMFYDWDVITSTQIQTPTVASLMPLCTGVITRRQQARIEQLLKQTDFCGQQGCSVQLAPSAPLNSTTFNHELYWRGPIWININWFLWRGFTNAGMEDTATSLKNGMLELMEKQGFREYYSPLTGEGLGAQDFSWSAALAIDLLNN